MAILNTDAVADARTTFEALAKSALQNNKANGAWSRVARRVSADGIAHQTIIAGATPAWSEWVGEKDFGGFRKYARTTPLKTYHKSIELKRADVVYDKDGSTAAALNTLVRDFDDLYDKLVFDKLSANPTGVDGAALLSATHPFGSSTTWDNLTSTALSFSEFDAMYEDMINLKNEFGDPLNLRPRVLVVACDIQREAREIVGAMDRPVSVSTAGAMNGAAGATGITNIYKGDNFELIITPRFTSGQWVMIDPDFPPIKLAVWREPEPIIVDDMTADQRVRKDVFLYGAEADIAADGEQPWGIAGKL
jgi:phage major head subunit gpT-like protein